MKGKAVMHAIALTAAPTKKVLATEAINGSVHPDVSLTWIIVSVSQEKHAGLKKESTTLT